MVIDISDHYFRYYANQSELSKLNTFQVGEIVTDWCGDIGCILTISKSGDVRTDSNGMGELTKLHKLRNGRKIAAYLKDLYKSDIEQQRRVYEKELKNIK